MSRPLRFPISGDRPYALNNRDGYNTINVVRGRVITACWASA